MSIWQSLQEINNEIKLSALRTSDRKKNRQRRFVIEIDIYVNSVWHNSNKSSINRKDLRYTFSIWHVRVTYKDETIEQKIYWRKSVSKLRICSCLSASCHLNFFQICMNLDSFKVRMFKSYQWNEKERESVTISRNYVGEVDKRRRTRKWRKRKMGHYYSWQVPLSQMFLNITWRNNWITTSTLYVFTSPSTQKEINGDTSVNTLS